MISLLFALLLTVAGPVPEGAADPLAADPVAADTVAADPVAADTMAADTVSPGMMAAAPSVPALEVYLLTMDQGDEVWELFGHNALLIRDPLSGQEVAWNWGLFNFEDVDFIPRFLRGTMRYSMGPAELGPFLDSYARAGRTVYANRVNLTPAEAAELDAFVRWNYLPENRPYIYDYYRDNCSTRVRDALDRVLGGAIHEAFAPRETPRSWRWHSRRMVQVTGWVDHGLSFLLGTRGDAAVTEWEAMFLPTELMELLEGFDVTRTDGSATPLLGPRMVWVASGRPPTPETPPAFSPLWLLLGLGAAVALAAVGRWAREDRDGARRILAGVGAVWGVGTGLLGAILVASWWTDHVFIQWNLNILYVSPLGLVLTLALLPGLVRRRWWMGLPGTLALGAALVVAATSLVGGVIQLTGLATQGNAEVVALALPVNLALAWALLRARRAPLPGQEPGATLV
ncbi:MAG: DUF4105 domain-containing protein [Gemmatimonadales bacterium]|nr:MAG: DUF4105 domain-containing protein [Gemmatimonadales bacterium]